MGCCQPECQTEGDWACMSRSPSFDTNYSTECDTEADARFETKSLHTEYITPTHDSSMTTESRQRVSRVNLESRYLGESSILTRNLTLRDGASTPSQSTRSCAMPFRTPLRHPVPSSFATNSLQDLCHVSSFAVTPRKHPYLSEQVLAKCPPRSLVPMRKITCASTSTATPEESDDQLFEEPSPPSSEKPSKREPTDTQVTTKGDLATVVCMEDAGKLKDESQPGIGELKRQISALRNILKQDGDQSVPSDHAHAFALLQRGLNALEHHPEHHQEHHPL